MLSKSDISIQDVLPRFTGCGLEVAFLVPTPTGLEKAILDAVGPLRDFLKRKRFHDFGQQAQSDKALHQAYFVYEDRLERTTASLYRPQTKSGDPRIWFYGLSKYAGPFNLLAILCENNELYVVNASRPSIINSIEDVCSPLGALAQKNAQLQPAAVELLEKLREIGRSGFIESMRRGDTGVGYTLESKLGIRANTSKDPDFQGIEIKASRKFGRGATENRVTLFSQVPKWSRSKLRSGKEILESFGYERGGRRQLYCTVGSQPNSQGLYFDAVADDLLWNRARIDTRTTDVVCWETPQLIARLLEKHPSTMWVKAKCKGERQTCEEFHYVEAVFTRNPLASSLIPLIEAGTVTMDYTLSVKDGGATRDHGYLFKIRPEDLPTLFPPPRRFDLTS